MQSDAHSLGNALDAQPLQGKIRSAHEQNAEFVREFSRNLTSYISY